MEEPIIPSTYDDDPAFYTQRAHFRIDPSLFVLALTLIALAVMGWGYFRMLRSVTLQIDLEPLTIFTNQTTVAGVLNDAALSLFPEDIVFPAFDAPIPDIQPILQAEIKKVAESGNLKLVIDLGEVAYLNSSALGVLISAHANYANAGGKLNCAS